MTYNPMCEDIKNSIQKSGLKQGNAKIDRIVYSFCMHSFEGYSFSIKDKYEIRADGNLWHRFYRDGNRKAESIRKYYADPKTVEQMFQKLLNCLEKCDEVEFIIDDQFAELNIFYNHQKLTYPRGVSSEGVLADSIIGEFIAEFIPEEDDEEIIEDKLWNELIRLQ